MKRDFTEMYCFVDDFMQGIATNLTAINSSKLKPGKKNSLSSSEVLSILLGYYESCCDCFKQYYEMIIMQDHRDDFKLVSYAHFTRLIGMNLQYLVMLLHHLLKNCTGISFVESTSIAVCKNYRIYSHRVFDCFANRSKTTKGWFFGLKLHLVIDPQGNLIKVSLSSGNKDDRKALKEMIPGLFGKIFGDRGYISKELFEELHSNGIQLVTRLKKGMKNVLMPIMDKVMKLGRALIESVIGKLKFLDKLEHSRHRSVTNAFCHMIANLINYQLQDSKPSIATIMPEETLSTQY